MTYSKDKELEEKARGLRNNMTRAEIILWSRLRMKQLGGYKFRRQQKIYDYIVDFYCHKLRLIIEVDGDIHSSLKQAEHDKSRDKILKINGYNVFRLSNYDIETNLDASVNKIKLFISQFCPPTRGTAGGL